MIQLQNVECWPFPRRKRGRKRDYRLGEMEKYIILSLLESIQFFKKEKKRKQKQGFCNTIVRNIHIAYTQLIYFD